MKKFWNFLPTLLFISIQTMHFYYDSIVWKIINVWPQNQSTGIDGNWRDMVEKWWALTEKWREMCGFSEYDLKPVKTPFSYLNLIKPIFIFELNPVLRLCFCGKKLQSFYCQENFKKVTSQKHLQKLLLKIQNK